MALNPSNSSILEQLALKGLSGINAARRRANLNETALGLSAAQIRSHKTDFNLAMASHRAALSGNA